MPDRRRAMAGVVVAALALFGLAVPAALAQEDPPPQEWEGSQFTKVPNPAKSESVTIEGRFVREGDGTVPELIATVELRYGRTGDDGEFVDADDDTCVPEDPGFVEDTNPDDDTFTFAHTASFPCNGRFVVEATASSPPRPFSGRVSRYALRADVNVAVAPAPVTEIEATKANAPDKKTGATEDDPETVTISFTPLGESELASDALGYRVHRYGPITEGQAGAPVRVGDDLPVDAEPTATDTVTRPGLYRYVVHSLRSGPSGPVLSPLEGSGTAEVTVAGAPGTSTTTTTPSSITGPVDRQPLTVPQVGPGRRRGSGGAPRAPRAPNSDDGGFSETLDYGDREFGESDELAGEGQSIVRTDDAGVGLATPVAGALVLLGWAGHVAYVNRLARQF